MKSLYLESLDSMTGTQNYGAEWVLFANYLPVSSPHDSLSRYGTTL